MIACSFSGSLAKLTLKQKKDKIAVLRALSNDPNVSIWDMDRTGILWATIVVLIRDGYVMTVPEHFPWHKFVITEDGKKILEKEE